MLASRTDYRSLHELAGRALALASPGECLTYRTAEANPADVDGPLLADESALVSGASEPRRREFTAGRVLARKALDALGLPSAPVLRGLVREPLWPHDVSGSITHTQGYCGVVVTSAPVTIGIDAEADIIEPDLWPKVCTPRELWMLSGLHHRDAASAAKLIFGAKEAGYKAQFQRTHEFLDFDAAEVDMDVSAGVFHLRFLRPVGHLCDAGATFPGAYGWRGETLVCAVAIPQQRLATAAG